MTALIITGIVVVYLLIGLAVAVAVSWKMGEAPEAEIAILPVLFWPVVIVAWLLYALGKLAVYVSNKAIKRKGGRLNY